MRWSHAAALSVLLLAAGARADQATPEPPSGENVGLWEGIFTDLGPGYAFTRVALCRDGAAVRGTVAFDGTNGRDRRQVEGAWQGGQLLLRDVQFLTYRPAPGIRICACILYRFRLDARGRLVGDCVTDEACGNHNRIELMRSGKIAPCSTPTASPSTKKPPTRSGSGSD